MIKFPKFIKLSKAALPVFFLFTGSNSCAHSSYTLNQDEKNAISISTYVGVNGATLSGTMLLPNSKGHFPAAIIIAGSGPTDRDGNSKLLPGANNSLKFLAEGLASHHIATIRYDKRGVGESEENKLTESQLRIETYVDDLIAWIESVREDSTLTSLTLIGHSEGALIALIAAKKVKVDGLVLIAAPGRNLSSIIEEQLANAPMPDDFRITSKKILATLTAGDTTSSVPYELYGLFRPSVQPYLISSFAYSPTELIKAINVPTLIIQGTADAQVTKADADNLAKAQPAAKLLLIDGMNHLLKVVPTDKQSQADSYSNPNIPIPTEVLSGIEKLIKGIRAR